MTSSSPRINYALVESENPFLTSSPSCLSLFSTSTPKKTLLVDHQPKPKSPKKRRLEFYSSPAPSEAENYDGIEVEPDTSTTGNTIWSLSAITEFKGCANKCASTVHDLIEYDILTAHLIFSSRDTIQQRQWLFDYFSSHCPNAPSNRKDTKNMKFLLCGKEVCFPLWLLILSVSSSRYYQIRKEYADGKSLQGHRSMSVKSCQAIAWLTSFFDRIGDKRPDKADGIYLPTCLTERSIYDRMINDLHKGDSENAICFSQFNRIYRTEFPNVTIPKVSWYIYM